MKLSYAIIISLLGHGILLMSWPVTFDFGVTPTPAYYQVVISEMKFEKKSPTIKKITTPKIIKKNIVKKQQQKETKHKTSNSKAYVISRLNLEIRNNFKYPILARRNGWQGKVILGLSINSQGSIENAHIKSGSGYRILDQSALKALLKVQNIQKTENWFNIDYQEISIPVIYRLQKG